MPAIEDRKVDFDAHKPTLLEQAGNVELATAQPSLARYSRLSSLAKRDWSQRYSGAWGVIDG